MKERTDIITLDILSICYKLQENILEIEFYNQNIYQYFDVPFHIFESLWWADSQWDYFKKFIKWKFDSDKVRK